VWRVSPCAGTVEARSIDVLPTKHATQGVRIGYGHATYTPFTKMDIDEKMMKQIMEILTEIKANMKASLEETKARRDKRLEDITNGVFGW
jgi:Ni,Fe-hydrogenase III large subunit